MKKQRKEEKGITLIALVITIIVLLILAAVSIATLTGENGILTKAQEAKIQNTKSQAEEDVKLAVGKLQIEESQKQMTQEEKRKFLEDEFKEKEPDASVDTKGTGFVANYSGYEVEIDNKYNVTVKEPFNAEEWDKTAASEDCFLWGSDVEGEEGYNSIVGWTEKIESYSLLRIPSRCQEIVCDGTYDGITSNEGKGRAFTKNILKVELPETVVNIGNQAFSGHEYPYTSFQSLKEINIPNSVTNIGEKAFRNCRSLTDIIGGNNVTNIGDDAFWYTNIDNSDWYNSHTDGVVYIGKVAYCYDKTISSNTNIELRDGTIQIGKGAFENCTELTSIKIPNTVTNIRNRAFFNCTGLTSITIPDSVTSIEALAFGFWRSTQTINCKVASKPSEWSDKWYYDYMGNPSEANIIWGYTGE